MGEWLAQIDPTWIILAVGVVVALGMYLVLRNVGAKDPEAPPLEVQPEVSPHGERRAAPRRRTGPILVDLVDPEGKMPRRSALLADYSTGGLALTSTEEIPVGSLWTLVPRASAGTVKVGLPIEIRNCVRQQSDYLVSCQFTRTVSYNELLNFG
jgi:hypothetical protein